jgi:hypothetical protein
MLKPTASWTPMQRFAIDLCGVNGQARDGVDFVTVERQEWAESVYAKCLHALQKLETQPTLGLWEEDPYLDLAASMYRCDPGDVTTKEREIAKVIFLRCLLATKGMVPLDRAKPVGVAASGVPYQQNSSTILHWGKVMRSMTQAFCHRSETDLTTTETDAATTAFDQCLVNLENWVQGDIEDPVTGWHPFTVFAARMYGVAEENVNKDQRNHAMYTFERHRRWLFVNV